VRRSIALARAAVPRGPRRARVLLPGRRARSLLLRSELAVCTAIGAARGGLSAHRAATAWGAFFLRRVLVSARAAGWRRAALHSARARGCSPRATARSRSSLRSVRSQSPPALLSAGAPSWRSPRGHGMGRVLPPSSWRSSRSDGMGRVLLAGRRARSLLLRCYRRLGAHRAATAWVAFFLRRVLVSAGPRGGGVRRSIALVRAAVPRGPRRARVLLSGRRACSLVLRSDLALWARSGLLSARTSADARCTSGRDCVVVGVD